MLRQNDVMQFHVIKINKRSRKQKRIMKIEVLTKSLMCTTRRGRVKKQFYANEVERLDKSVQCSQVLLVSFLRSINRPYDLYFPSPNARDTFCQFLCALAPKISVVHTKRSVSHWMKVGGRKCMRCDRELAEEGQHCRACGFLVCRSCSTHSAMLFDEFRQGRLMRVCDACFHELQDSRVSLGSQLALTPSTSQVDVRKEIKESFSGGADADGLIVERKDNAAVAKIKQKNKKLVERQRKAWAKLLKGQRTLVVNKKLKKLVRRGIPPDRRGRIWPLLCGAAEKSQFVNEQYYKQLLAEADTEVWRRTEDASEMEKDLNGPFPKTVAEGLPMLRRILTAYSIHNPVVGYCQSLHFVVALLLLFLDEEDAFWMLTTIVESLCCVAVPIDGPSYDLPPTALVLTLPSGAEQQDSFYFQRDVAGVRIDQAVFSALVNQKLPRVAANLKELNVALEPLTVKWCALRACDLSSVERFLCLFVNTLPLETTLRVWDCFFSEGVKIIFRAALTILKINQKAILACSTRADLLLALHSFNTATLDSERFVRLMFDPFFLGSFPLRRVQFLRMWHKARIVGESKPCPVSTVSVVSAVKEEEAPPPPPEEEDELKEEESVRGRSSLLQLEIANPRRRKSVLRGVQLEPRETLENSGLAAAAEPQDEGERDRLRKLQLEMDILLQESHRLKKRGSTEEYPEEKGEVEPSEREKKKAHERGTGVCAIAGFDTPAVEDMPPPPPPVPRRSAPSKPPPVQPEAEESEESEEEKSEDEEEEEVNEVLNASCACVVDVDNLGEEGALNVEEPVNEECKARLPVSAGQTAFWPARDIDFQPSPRRPKVPTAHPPKAPKTPSEAESDTECEVDPRFVARFEPLVRHVNHMSRSVVVIPFESCAGCGEQLGKDEKSVFALGKCVKAMRCNVVACVCSERAQVWHPHHFVCVRCECELVGQKYFVRDGSAFCRNDYLQTFGQRCGVCNEFVLNGVGTDKSGPHGAVFHHSCVKCALCSRQLDEKQKEKFFQHEGKLYCEKDFQKMLRLGSPACGRCGKLIQLDKDDGVKVAGTAFHRKCLSCAVCNALLADVAKNESVLASTLCPTVMYCAKHQNEEKCKVCHEPIALLPTDVYRVPSGAYHARCTPEARCKGCSYPVEKGDKVEVAFSGHSFVFHTDCLRCSAVKCERAVVNQGTVFLDETGRPYCEEHRYAMEKEADKAADPTEETKPRGAGARVESIRDSTVCFKCRQNLQNEPNILVLRGHKFHPDCVTCATCQKVFVGGLGIFPHPTTFGMFFCETHFTEKFCDACEGCKKPLVQGAVVRIPLRGRTVLFHQNCFVCSRCEVQRWEVSQVPCRCEQPFAEQRFLVHGEKLVCSDCAAFIQKSK